MRLVAVLFALALMLPALSHASDDADWIKGVALHNRRDFAAALHIWFPLAERGHAPAQGSLGDLYYFGQGVAVDPDQAVIWYRRAADQGEYLGQFGLGTAYADGAGVPQDDKLAYVYFSLAASGPDDHLGSAEYERERVASRMSPDELADAKALATFIANSLKSK